MVYHKSSEDLSQEESEPKNFFRNDGSFLEMFKKMQGNSATTATTKKSSSSSSSTSSSSSSRSSSSPSLPSPSNHSPATTCTTHLPVVTKDRTSFTNSKTSSPEPDQKMWAATETEGKTTSTTLNSKFPIFGKRRGGKALPIGKVKKLKVEPKEEKVEEPKGAWSQYLAEVKKYKETVCEEDGKRRPLVK